MKFVTSFPEKNYGEKLALAAAVRYRYSLLGKNHRTEKNTNGDISAEILNTMQ
jgi:hypothetical protein